MTCPEEQSWLYHFGRSTYGGRGDIADLGCWFGSSTIALAQGLADNPRLAEKAERIHAFDLFEWESWMQDTLARRGVSTDLTPGASFLPQFEERIAPWSALVRAHPGDLNSIGWPPARPLELVFNDAAKTLGLGNAIRRDFFPALIPQDGYVVEQDFAHFYTPWVHLSQWRLREYFSPVVYVPYSGSMVFRLEREIPADRLAPLSFDDFDDDEIDAAFERSLGLVDRPMRANVWASRCMLEVHRGRPADALRMLDGDRHGRFYGPEYAELRRTVDAAAP